MVDYANNQLRNNTLWMLFGQGAKILIQATFFVLIARGLGSQGYGSFIAVVALTTIFVPFSGIGTGNILIKNVSRNTSSFNIYWGNSLFIIVVSGIVFIIILLIVSMFALPNEISLLLVLYIGISDMICMKLIEVSGQAFIAFQRMKWTANMQVLLGLARLLTAIILFFIVETKDPLTWALFYFISTMIISVLCVIIVNTKLGSPHLNLSLIPSSMKEGIYFSVGLSSQSIYNEIDKTMLAKYATLSAAGVFAAAYRLIDVAFTPVRALLSATYTKYFQYGVDGIHGTIKLTKKLFPLTILYGLFVAIVLYVVAQYVPFILGDEYVEAVSAVKLLAILPFLKIIHYFAADTLTGADFQGIRSIVQVAIAIFNFLMNLILIPKYSWLGATWSTIASDLLLGIILWCTVSIIYAKEKKRMANMKETKVV